jgi:hypothetical protein
MTVDKLIDFLQKAKKEGRINGNSTVSFEDEFRKEYIVEYEPEIDAEKNINFYK